MNSILINNKKITRESKPYTIAEVGINHNGKFEKAIEMIKIAKSSGVDCIKFQTFKAEEIIDDKTINYKYKCQNKIIVESMYEMFKRYELNDADWFNIKKYCDEIKIDFLSTPQNPSDLDLLFKVGINAIKIGSDDFNNIPLIKYYMKFNLPLILSIGMSNEEEIKEVVKTFESYNFKKYIFMLCTSSYPTPSNQVNLNKIKSLKKISKNKIVGFSDHTIDNYSSMIAVGLGAKIFEKHYTLDKNDIGPDHEFSLNPEELKTWVNSIHLSYELLGSSKLEPTPNELRMKKIARRSITAIKDISIGELFSMDNLGLRRPSDGIEPKNLDSIIGKISKRFIKKGEKIKKNDF